MSGQDSCSCSWVRAAAPCTGSSSTCRSRPPDGADVARAACPKWPRSRWLGTPPPPCHPRARICERLPLHRMPC
eukprot:803261-Prymnesium_polylepis.1